jgi:chromatin remodeling complex protein RSC6
MPKTTPTVEVNTDNTNTTTTTTTVVAPVKKVKKVRVSKKKVVKNEEESVVKPLSLSEVMNNTVETPVAPVVETPVVETPIAPVVETPVVETPVVESETITEEHIEEDESDKKKKKTLKKEDIIPKWDYLFEAYETELKSARKQANQTVSLLKYLTQLKNDTYKLMKLRKRRQDQEKQSGFMKPVGISEELKEFFNCGNNVNEQPTYTRVYITKQLCNYIKQKDLQNPGDKRTIIPDDKLKRLFQIGDNEKEKLTYYSIQQRIQRHIYKL